MCQYPKRGRVNMNVFEIDPAEREQTYRDLRDALAQDYSIHVGPHQQRNARHQITKQRAAGGHHEHAADSQEQRLERDISEYDEGVHEKYLLAILTGRYDHALQELTDPSKIWSNTFPQHNTEIVKAAKTRLSEM